MATKTSMREITSFMRTGDDAQWTMFRAASVLRVVVLGSVLIALRLLPDAARTQGSHQAILVLVGLDFVLTFVYYRFGKSHTANLRSLTLVVLLIEVVVVTIGLWLVRPQYSVYGLPIYLFLVVASAALHSRSGAYAIAGFAALAYAGGRDGAPGAYSRDEIGSVKRKVAPFPGADSRRIRPPACVTMVRTSARPSPSGFPRR